MPNKCQIVLSNEWVCDHLSDVTDITKKKVAWALIQEPGFIGFGVVESDKIWWPPNKPENSPDWELTSDLRLFGERGEWHVWRDWDGNHYARLQKLEEIDDALTEYHALWGTEKKDTDSPAWIKVVEKRGTEIWLPLQGQIRDSKNGSRDDSDLPLRLEIKQIVGYDPKFHLAGIVDAVLVSLVRKSSEEPLFADLSQL